MLDDLLSGKRALAVIGLGYVGLPVALGMAKHVPVIGFDINKDRVAQLQQGTDPANELTAADFSNSNIRFTADAEVLREAVCFIVAVPTPVDDHNVPDLSMLLKAAATVGSVISEGGYVIFESTVYPGCTEEDCVPVIEKISGLALGTGFKVGYSPERINPGDQKHTLQNIIKVVAGCDEVATETIAKLYGMVTSAGVHKVSSIRVAEAAKIIENTQRDLNIALMNELSIIFDKMGINTFEVLEAAATKWNFVKFSPGLVGGHCIGVDPYYLTYKAAELGYSSKVILAGRYINDGMGAYVAKKVVQHIIANCSNVRDARVLIMGATFKENVTDIRNSKVADVVHSLQAYHLQVEVTDPGANSDELQREYGFGLIQVPHGKYDAVVIAVCHKEYLQLTGAYFESITQPHALIADIRGIYRNHIQSRQYWSL
ncbi:nucleotide sugar dehydrogenase [Deminuibacter soli]|uniref:Nucleotide sugar dehydrogenase n=2 Tax=Deminuibacter soli TaxID=2291815 RepID=A0A3E1NML9_9BACT|nr:nucleotide sugar dehydrogenase [Deminuibacter soli]